jgi:hypothetical protein
MERRDESRVYNAISMFSLSVCAKYLVEIERDRREEMEERKTNRKTQAAVRSARSTA